jgi:putative acetyltransferase
MILIRPIRVDEIPAARHVILSVAYGIFGWEGTLEDSVRHFETSGEFKDMDNLQEHYFGNGGLFLVALDDNKVIGSGAIRKLDEATAELKRMWLLEDYQGKGIGYRLITRLFDFGRAKGYIRARLQTGTEQTRALAFYHRLGFYEIPCYTNEIQGVSLEVTL